MLFSVKAWLLRGGFLPTLLIGSVLCILILCVTVPPVIEQHRLLTNCLKTTGTSPCLFSLAYSLVFFLYLTTAVVNMNTIKEEISNFMHMKTNHYWIPEIFYDYSLEIGGKQQKFGGTRFYASYEDLTLNFNKHKEWAAALVSKVLRDATIPDNTHDHRARIDICVDPQRPWFSFVLEEYNIVPYLIVALASQVKMLIIMAKIPKIACVLLLKVSSSQKPGKIDVALTCGLLLTIFTWPFMLHFIVVAKNQLSLAEWHSDAWVYVGLIESVFVWLRFYYFSTVKVPLCFVLYPVFHCLLFKQHKHKE